MFQHFSKNFKKIYILCRKRCFQFFSVWVVAESVWHMFLWTVGKVYSAIRDALRPHTGAGGWKCISRNLYSVQND